MLDEQLGQGVEVRQPVRVCRGGASGLPGLGANGLGVGLPEGGHRLLDSGYVKGHRLQQVREGRLQAPAIVLQLLR
eukprot:2350314-Alexandrium_andersonii.AAC.1